jgi:transcriptional regulator with XRE-family HTH domain
MNTQVGEVTTPLREWRLRNELTLVDLSGLTGLSDGFLSRLERGKRNLSPLERVRVARAVGARVEELFPPNRVSSRG